MCTYAGHLDANVANKRNYMLHCLANCHDWTSQVITVNYFHPFSNIQICDPFFNWTNWYFSPKRICLSFISAKEDINYVYWLFGVGVGVGEVFRSGFRYISWIKEMISELYAASKIVSTNSKGNKIIFILFLISVRKFDFVFVSNEMGLHLGFNWCYFIISNIRLTSPEPARRSKTKQDS